MLHFCTLGLQNTNGEYLSLKKKNYIENAAQSIQKEDVLFREAERVFSLKLNTPSIQALYLLVSILNVEYYINDEKIIYAT